jgi:hypothetical protein
MKRCYKEAEFIPRIEKALQVQMPSYTCHIVDQKEMSNVMGRAGWNKSQTRGVVGFHLKDNVYVLRDAPWTTLHELIHRGGVNADRINRHLAEGLTELIASDLKKGSDEHKSTYPNERKWVAGFLKKLNMNSLQLGSFIANSSNPPADVAQLLKDKGLSEKSLGALTASLRAQVEDAPSLNARQGSATIVPPGIDWEVIGFSFLFALGLATLIKRRQ